MRQVKVIGKGKKKKKSEQVGIIGRGRARAASNLLREALVLIPTCSHSCVHVRKETKMIAYFLLLSRGREIFKRTKILKD